MKNKNSIKLLFTIVMIFLGISLTAQTTALPPANFNEENAGTEDNPYQIETLANLRWLSETPEVWGTITPLVQYYFLQTNDIDASETTEWGHIENYYEYFEGFKGIGTYLQPFTGFYDGQNYKIEHLYSRVGFFNFIDNATLQNINVVNVEISGKGSLVNYSNESIIKNCQSSGYLGYCFSGGLIGYADSSQIMFCSTTININLLCMSDTVHPIGGLVGTLRSSLVSDSYFYGSYQNHSGFNPFGGLVGIIDESSETRIQNCYATTNEIYPMSNWVGGICVSVYSFGSLPIFSNNFWNSEITGIDVPSSSPTTGFPDMTSYGLLTSQMVTASTYINAGWDFVNVWDINSDINNGYPFIRTHRDISNVSNKDKIISPIIEFTAYPNPFNPTTTISFTLKKSGDVNLDIYNLKGQKVKSLVDDFKESGQHIAIWNGLDNNGMPVGSGIYFYRIKTDNFFATKKFTLMK